MDVRWPPALFPLMPQRKTLYQNLKTHGVFVVTQSYTAFLLKVGACFLYISEEFVHLSKNKNFFMLVDLQVQSR